MNETSLTQERLIEALDYDPETGIFTWKVNSPRARIGAVAGYKHRQRDRRMAYCRIRIGGKVYEAHRLVYLFMTGKMPPEELDVAHDDQDGLNNRWENLSIMSSRENSLNQRRFKTNTSGFTGVYWHKKKKKWHAGIKIHGKSIHLGYFPDKNEARVARKAAEKRYGFHRLHGSG